jgi:lysophospholipase L1-like esterase
MLLEKHTTLVMTGDSLTDTGRGRPVGTLRSGLGTGYVMLVQAVLGAFYPEHAIKVINTGISGNTIRDIENRWREDVLDLKPDYISLMCGINDVWRQFNIFDDIGLYVPYEEFCERYRRVIEASLSSVKGMFLLTPYTLTQQRRRCAQNGK